MRENISHLAVIVLYICNFVLIHFGIMQNLLPFLGPLLRKSSEACRNFSVIKSLRESENLQVSFTALIPNTHIQRHIHSLYVVILGFMVSFSQFICRVH